MAIIKEYYILINRKKFLHHVEQKGMKPFHGFNAIRRIFENSMEIFLKQN